ncbi:hypothetical protein GCM10023201_35540 [Actinomycetospora corticicola]
MAAERSRRAAVAFASPSLRVVRVVAGADMASSSRRVERGSELRDTDCIPNLLYVLPLVTVTGGSVFAHGGWCQADAGQ